MAYQITLTDDEYTALKAVAEQRGASVDALVHETLAREYETTSTTQATAMDREFLEHLHRKGVLSHIATGEEDSAEEEAELEVIARRIGPEKPWLSEMIIEDRGPR
ncbi:MAG TPA: hypothetical protein VKT52_08715 [Ktedonobacterales bacterium]|nr:hypothetical protein [Ktedonobacterales bacterium]